MLLGVVDGVDLEVYDWDGGCWAKPSASRRRPLVCRSATPWCRQLHFISCSGEQASERESRERSVFPPLPQALTLDRLPTHNMHYSRQAQTFDT